jgi:hypothetical protein
MYLHATGVQQLKYLFVQMTNFTKMVKEVVLEKLHVSQLACVIIPTEHRRESSVIVDLNLLFDLIQLEH